MDGLAEICGLCGQIRPNQRQKIIHLFRRHPEVFEMAISVQGQFSHKMVEHTKFLSSFVDGVDPHSSSTLPIPAKQHVESKGSPPVYNSHWEKVYKKICIYLIQVKSR